jgi:hypothetical protein
MVFTTETGGFCGRGRILRHLHGLLIKNDLPDCTVHSLRHTFASILINEGVHIKAVSAILGHSSVRVTSDIYAHAFADYEAKAAEAISLALGIIAGEKPERGAQTEGETRGIGAEGGQKGDKKGRRKSATKLRQKRTSLPLRFALPRGGALLRPRVSLLPISPPNVTVRLQSAESP